MENIGPNVGAVAYVNADIMVMKWVINRERHFLMEGFRKMCESGCEIIRKYYRL